MAGDEQYECFEVLGQNDYHTVYRGWSREPPRYVAIMELHQKFRANPEQFGRIWEEVLSYAGFSHTGLVPVYGVNKKAAWIITALMPDNLAARMTKQQLTNKQVRSALRTGLEALAFLHGKGKLHGDVRPNTLLIDEAGKVRLSHPVGLTLGGQVPRSKLNPKYLAPELVESRHGPMGFATDLYALGFSAYELLVGKEFDKQFKIDADRQLTGNLAGIGWLRWHQSSSELHPIAELVPTTAADIADVISRLTRKKVAERIASAEEALLLLSDDDNDVPAFEAGPASPPPAEEPVRPRPYPRPSEKVSPISSPPPRPVKTPTKPESLIDQALKRPLITWPLTIVGALLIGLVLKGLVNGNSEESGPQSEIPRLKTDIAKLQANQQTLNGEVDGIGKAIKKIDDQQKENFAELTRKLDQNISRMPSDLATRDQGLEDSVGVITSRLNERSTDQQLKPVVPETSFSANEYAGRAESLLADGDLDGAVQNVELALQKAKSEGGSFSDLAFAIYNALGTRQRESKDYEEAIKTFGKALGHAKSEAHRATVLGNRGLVYFDRKTYDAAIQEFEAAVKANPDADRTWAEQLSVAYLVRGTERYENADFEGAIKDLTPAVAHQPHSAEALALLASSEAHLQKTDQAIGHFSSAFEQSPSLRKRWAGEAAECFQGRASARVAAGEKEAALADLDAAVGLLPSSPEILVTRANLLTDLARYDAAIADFERAREQASNLPATWSDGARTAYLARGRARAAGNSHRLAVTDYSVALRLAPQDEGTYFARATSYVALDSFESALEDFDRGIELHDQSAEHSSPSDSLAAAVLGRGTVCLRLQLHEKAVRDFSRLIDGGSQDPAVFVKRGIALENLTRHEAAIADFDHAIEIDSGWSVPFNNRGVALLAQGKNPEAERDFSMAIALDDTYSDAYYNRHIVNYRLGRQSDADADLQRSQQLNNIVAVQ